ncbi:hypothetical protein PT089_02790 [Erysipelothrix rhusiopathiae]|nr:hypothetical protein [Erysipelothrix rhusiopathiae]
MPFIKFRFQDGDIGSYAFPLSLTQLREWFPDGFIPLLKHQDVPWLEHRENQAVNAYDLNVLCRIYDSLDYKSARKLDAICFINNNLTLNEIIHISKHMNCFGLIDSFEDFANPSQLAKELAYQHYPQGIPNMEHEDDSEEAWTKRGHIAKTELKHQITDYGWLFNLADVPVLSENEIPFYNVSNQEYLVQLTATNPDTEKTISLSLPLHSEEFEENLTRVSLNLDKLIFEVKNLSFDTGLWKKMEPLIHEAELLNINQFVYSLNALRDSEVEKLKSVLSQIHTDELSQIEFIIENLYEFELISIDSNNPKEYAKHQLDELLNRDFEQYQKWLADYLDYQTIGERLLQEELVVQTEFGYLQVPEPFSHFFDSHIQQLKDPS